MCLPYLTEESLKGIKHPEWFKNLKRLEWILKLLNEGTTILVNSDEKYTASVEPLGNKTICYKCGKVVTPEDGFRLRVQYAEGHVAEETRVFHRSHF